MSARTGGRALVDALVANGVDTVFCVPGESFIAVLDALSDTTSIRTVACRHEASAAHMAEARGKLTGRPGIAFVTRAPGATHASIGVHIARQDSTPMILFVGQVARGMRGREAFQEIDYAQVFGGLAKWAVEIDDAARIPELVTRAFHVAISGRPGPVVLALPERVRSADLILAVGGRLGEIPTGGFTLIEAPRPKQRLVHVHADPDELGRVFAADLAINAGPAEFAHALDALEPPAEIPWRTWAADARADYEHWSTPGAARAALDPAHVVRYLDERLPEDAILCNGAGNYTTWLHRFFRYKRFGTQLGPTAGAMGYGFPAAISAKLHHPDRIALAFAGDGCFLMSGAELATAVQYGANVITLVWNNAMYGTIRMHQERTYPGRVWATDLTNPDFAAYARAFGAHGALVTRTEDFPAAFEDALAAGKPALIELRTDPDLITPTTTLSEIRGG